MIGNSIATNARAGFGAAFLFALSLCLGSPATAADAVLASPAPSPAVKSGAVFQIGGAVTSGSFGTNGRNALGAFDVLNGLDRSSRTDFTNALITPTLDFGKFHAGTTIGYYDLPTVGCALNPTTQAGANMSLFSAIPLYDVSYAPNAHLTFSAGKLQSQLSQESMFTYQNFNVQRGLVWDIQPVVSHGIRAAYENGPWTMRLEGNDGFYGGATSRAFEGSLAYSVTGSQTFTFAMIAPKSTSGPNPTAAIANKHEEALMYDASFGRLVLTPYVLWVQSPSASALGYRNESAVAASLLGTYRFTPRYSLGFRYETIRNGSATNDTAMNADLVGYGPGSAARSFTLTPTIRSGWGIARLEWSSVDVTGLRPGLGFTATGAGTHQNRIALELGIIR